MAAWPNNLSSSRTEYPISPLMQDETQMRAKCVWAIKMLHRVCLCSVCSDSVVWVCVQMMMKWLQCNDDSKSLTEHSKFQSPQSKNGMDGVMASGQGPRFISLSLALLFTPFHVLFISSNFVTNSILLAPKSKALEFFETLFPFFYINAIFINSIINALAVTVWVMDWILNATIIKVNYTRLSSCRVNSNMNEFVLGRVVPNLVSTFQFHLFILL